MAFPWTFLDDSQGIINSELYLKPLLDEVYTRGGYPALLGEAERLHGLCRDRIQKFQKHLMDDESGLTRIADIARSINNRVEEVRKALKVRDIGAPYGGVIPIMHLKYVVCILHAMDMTVTLLPKEQKEESEEEIHV